MPQECFMKMYRVPPWARNSIQEVEVARTTPQFAVLKYGIDGERKESKNDYFETWEAAHQHLVGLARAKVNSAKGILEHEEANLVAALSMEPPK
jgi:hypothetical protein